MTSPVFVGPTTVRVFGRIPETATEAETAFVADCELATLACTRQPSPPSFAIEPVTNPSR